jgi:hypothetical protein
MRYLRLALLPLVFAACTEQQPAAPDIAVAPDFGATVTNEVIYVNPGRITWMDNDPALGEPWDVLLLGYDPADHAVCNDGEFVGGIPAKNHYVVTQEGFPDEFSQRDQTVLTTIGRPPLYLYLRSDIPFGAPDDVFCAFYKEGYIASGHWSAVLYMDNEVSWLDNTPGMNVYGGTENGVLWGADGAKYKYEWKYKLQWFPKLGVDRVVNSVDRVVRIK